MLRRKEEYARVNGIKVNSNGKMRTAEEVKEYLITAEEMFQSF
jgi:hypothetical protein